ncbi:MAG: Proline--tRNA ligase [candidate division WS2 bacterium]|nr:Proline--tRNA ligase [Candidatus Lithacetigena glycinireducens]
MTMIKNNTDKNEERKITPRHEDYSAWYLDIIAAADLAENGPVRGTMIIKPYGYALWERIQSILDMRFKKIGVKNAYFPLFIPEKFLKKEVQHVEGFAPEVAVVTHAGGKELEEPIVVRPTSETIIYDAFSNWIQSYRDLPLLINQWVNVVRWEMRPRLFLRTTEFLWQEGHTAHAMPEEADSFARDMLEVYRDFAENIMAIAVVPGMKSESEKFAGAYKTYTIEAMMQDGKALQFSTSHNLGENFAKVFDVMFLDEKGERKYASQTSWGLSTRTIGGLIMSHSDDKGLILPPRIAPIQAVITTIGHGADVGRVTDAAREIARRLNDAGIRCELDIRELRPGEKFYEWEKKGVPVRIELGPKDITSDSAILARRDTGAKQTVFLTSLPEAITTLLDTIQSDLFARSKERLTMHTKNVDSWEDFVRAINDGNFVLTHWCGDAEVEKQIKEETGATIRCIPFDQPKEAGVCVKSGRPSDKRVLFAKSY